MTSQSKTHTYKGSILVVDDAPDNLRLLSRILTKEGYRVRSAATGNIALMTVQVEPPDLILLDIKMPEMDGYEVCAHLKANAQTRPIPVIFLSAYGEEIDKIKAFRVGGLDYITKPFQVGEVLIRIENQLQLRRMQIELEQAKVEALRLLDRERELNRLRSEFTAMISHDFRTPLASIQGYAGLLRYSNAGLTAELQNRYFDKIDASVDYLLYLLDKILLIGSADVGKIQYQPAPLNLEAFCRELMETFHLNLDSHHQIAFANQGDCSEAEMDEALLRQILSNLLSNAIKYSPEGGEIRFALRCHEGLATFQIQDWGIGIPLEEQPYLFQTFYRCANVGQIRGTGLGLAVVKTCVEAHQGHLSLESTPGVGTLFTITLPLYPPDPEQP